MHANRLAAGHDPRLPGKTDVGVVQDQVRRKAVVAHALLDIPEAFEFLGRAGVLGKAREDRHVLHHERPAESAAEGVERGVGHGAFSWLRPRISSGRLRLRSRRLSPVTRTIGKQDQQGGKSGDRRILPLLQVQEHLDRQGVAAGPDHEDRRLDLVERGDECKQAGDRDAQRDLRQHDPQEAAQRRCPEIQRGFLLSPVEVRRGRP